jgi:predicted component of type VI protein secretion system
MSTLTITTGPSEGKTIECDRELVVGREGVDFVVEDSEMSRRHASIRPVAAGLEVEDLGSLNGTFVDGERISGPALLTTSATLKMGTTLFAVELTASDAPIADPQRTVARDQPLVDITDRTVVREVPEQPDLDVSDHTTVRDVAAEPVADASERTTVRPTREEPVVDTSDRTTVRPTPREEPVIAISDSTVVRDAPIIDVPDKTVVRDVAAQTPSATPVGAGPSAPPADGPGAAAGPPHGGPPGKPPLPVLLLMKSPAAKVVLPLLIKLPQRARPPALLLLFLLFIALIVAIIVVIVEVVF